MKRVVAGFITMLTLDMNAILCTNLQYLWTLMNPIKQISLLLAIMKSLHSINHFMNVSAYLSNYCFVLFIHKFCFLEQSLPDTSFSMKNTKDHLTWSNKTQLFFWEFLFFQAQFHHSRDPSYSLIDICFPAHQFYWINNSHHQSILSTIIQIPTQFSFSHFHDFPRLFSSFLVFFYGRTSSLVILFVFCFPFFPKQNTLIILYSQFIPTANTLLLKLTPLL